MEIKKLQTDIYFREKKKRRILIAVMVIITAITALMSLLIGQYGMNLWQTMRCAFGLDHGREAELVRKIIINIRLPRTLASIAIGGMLAVSGLTYQCVFRNTLASQDILGVSTGSCVGAALGIILGCNATQIQGMSFLMGMVTVGIVLVMSLRVKLDGTLSLVLSGVLVGGAMSSVLALIKYLASPEKHLQDIIFWTMGDISLITMGQLVMIAVPAAICIILIFIKRWSLNYFSYEDYEAKSIGVNLKTYRVLFLVCATTLVALSVSISGSIGWIGLVIPQLTRILTGTDNRDTIPIAFIMGSLFLLTVDIANRMISAAELPVSIISGLLGIPIFLICWTINIRRSRGRTEQ